MNGWEWGGWVEGLGGVCSGREGGWGRRLNDEGECDGDEKKREKMMRAAEKRCERCRRVRAKGTA